MVVHIIRNALGVSDLLRPIVKSKIFVRFCVRKGEGGKKFWKIALRIIWATPKPFFATHFSHISRKFHKITNPINHQKLSKFLFQFQRKVLGSRNLLSINHFCNLCQKKWDSGFWLVIFWIIFLLIWSNNVNLDKC